MSRVFANGPRDQSSISGRVVPKTQKWYLMLPCLTLSIKRLGSRVKCSNPGKGVTPSPTVVAIEKGAFGLPSTNFTNCNGSSSSTSGLVWFLYIVAYQLSRVIQFETQQWDYLTHSLGDKGVHIFLKGISPKVNVIEWMEFELTTIVAAQHVRHKAIGTALVQVVVVVVIVMPANNITRNDAKNKLLLFLFF